MTSKFDGFQHERDSENQSNLESTSDRFELLSAYIDGELTPTEKQQVQTWLDCDPDFKRLYIQLLALQGHLQHSVAPPSNKSSDEITTGVFESLDRSRRWRRKLFWGGGAIAASMVAGISGILPGTSPFSPQMVHQHTSPASSQVMLAVAIDQPAIHIPKSIVDYSEPTSDVIKPSEQ